MKLVRKWLFPALTCLIVLGAAALPARVSQMRDARQFGQVHTEALEADGWRPVGDVCLSPDDFAIVIGEKAYRARGIGRAAVSALIERARSLGWKQVRAGDIYDFNAGSRRLFASLGFREEAKTEKGHSYILPL